MIEDGVPGPDPFEFACSVSLLDTLLMGCCHSSPLSPVVVAGQDEGFSSPNNPTAKKSNSKSVVVSHVPSTPTSKDQGITTSTPSTNTTTTSSSSSPETMIVGQSDHGRLLSVLNFSDRDDSIDDSVAGSVLDRICATQIQSVWRAHQIRQRYQTWVHASQVLQRWTRQRQQQVRQAQHQQLRRLPTHQHHIGQEQLDPQQNDSELSTTLKDDTTTTSSSSTATVDAPVACSEVSGNSIIEPTLEENGNNDNDDDDDDDSLQSLENISSIEAESNLCDQPTMDPQPSPAISIIAPTAADVDVDAAVASSPVSNMGSTMIQMVEPTIATANAPFLQSALMALGYTHTTTNNNNNNANVSNNNNNALANANNNHGNIENKENHHTDNVDEQPTSSVTVDTKTVPLDRNDETKESLLLCTPLESPPTGDDPVVCEMEPSSTSSTTTTPQDRTVNGYSENQLMDVNLETTTTTTTTNSSSTTLISDHTTIVITTEDSKVEPGPSEAEPYAEVTGDQMTTELIPSTIETSDPPESSNPSNTDSEVPVVVDLNTQVIIGAISVTSDPTVEVAATTNDQGTESSTSSPQIDTIEGSESQSEDNGLTTTTNTSTTDDSKAPVSSVGELSVEVTVDQMTTELMPSTIGTSDPPESSNPSNTDSEVPLGDLDTQVIKGAISVASDPTVEVAATNDQGIESPNSSAQMDTIEGSESQSKDNGLTNTTSTSTTDDSKEPVSSVGELSAEVTGDQNTTELPSTIETSHPLPVELSNPSKTDSEAPVGDSDKQVIIGAISVISEPPTMDGAATNEQATESSSSSTKVDTTDDSKEPVSSGAELSAEVSGDQNTTELPFTIGAMDPPQSSNPSILTSTAGQNAIADLDEYVTSVFAMEVFANTDQPNDKPSDFPNGVGTEEDSEDQSKDRGSRSTASTTTDDSAEAVSNGAEISAEVTGDKNTIKSATTAGLLDPAESSDPSISTDTANDNSVTDSDDPVIIDEMPATPESKLKVPIDNNQVSDEPTKVATEAKSEGQSKDSGSATTILAVDRTTTDDSKEGISKAGEAPAEAAAIVAAQKAADKVDTNGTTDEDESPPDMVAALNQSISSSIVSAKGDKWESAEFGESVNRSVQFSPDTPTATKIIKSPSLSGRKDHKSPLQSLISKFDAGGSAFKTDFNQAPIAPSLSFQKRDVDTARTSFSNNNDFARLRSDSEKSKLEQQKLQKKNEELENQVAMLKAKLEKTENTLLESQQKLLESEEARAAMVEMAAESVANPSSSKTPSQDNPTKESSSTQMSKTTTHEQQQTLIEESGKMLEYLRKEVLRLRKENNALKTDLDNVGENTQRLMEANVIAQESFSSLNEKAKEQRQKAKSVELSYKQQIHDLQLAQDEMNDEIKMKQAAYIAEVRSKKQYEAALSRVVDLIHDKCRDSRLVEAVLQISDEVEEQQHHDLDDVTSVSLASPPDDTKLTDSMVGRFTSFFSSG